MNSEEFPLSWLVEFTGWVYWLNYGLEKQKRRSQGKRGMKKKVDDRVKTSRQEAKLQRDLTQEKKAFVL